MFLLAFVFLHFAFETKVIGCCCCCCGCCVERASSSSSSAFLDGLCWI